MIIDTHCHLDFDHFNADRDLVIERARKEGVEYIINVGSDPDGSKKSAELARKFDNIFATAGIHPHHAAEAGESAFSEIEKLLENEKVVAIGEVGLDYFKSASSPETQRELFMRFIELSGKTGLPLVIHSREAGEDTLSALKEKGAKPLKGVMHCFSGDRNFLERVLDTGLFVSFTCNLTFKNAGKLRETARFVPRDRLLLETDSPFLAPRARRGERNEPAYITHLADMLAELLNMDRKEIEKITTENARKLFGIPK